MLNRIQLIGNLGKDPDYKETTGGQGVCKISLATTEKYTNKAGEKIKTTEWHNIVLWGKLAEVCREYLRKGNLIYIEGAIKTRKWDNQEGATQYTTEIIGKSMQMLGGKPSGDSSSSSSSPPDDNDGGMEDDVPF